MKEHLWNKAKLHIIPGGIGSWQSNLYNPLQHCASHTMVAWALWLPPSSHWLSPDTRQTWRLKLLISLPFLLFPPLLHNTQIILRRLILTFILNSEYSLSWLIKGSNSTLSREREPELRNCLIRLPCLWSIFLIGNWWRNSTVSIVTPGR